MESTRRYQDEIIILNNKINEFLQEKKLMEENKSAVEDRLKIELEKISDLEKMKTSLETTLIEIEKKLDNEKSEKFINICECRRLAADLKLIESQFNQKKNDYEALVKYHQKEIDNLMNALERERLICFKIKKHNKELEERLNKTEYDDKTMSIPLCVEDINMKVIYIL